MGFFGIFLGFFWCFGIFGIFPPDFCPICPTPRFFPDFFPLCGRHPPIFLDAARALDEVTSELAVQIDLELGSEVTANAFKAAKQIIADRPGPSPVLLKVSSGNGEPVPPFRSRSMYIEPNEDTLGELEKLFGLGNVRLVRTATARAH